MDKEQKINNVNCKINDQYQLLVEMGDEDWRFPRHIMPNLHWRSRNINLYWQLYRSILGKYRYTSLELIVRSAALAIAHVAKSLISNPVRVADNENNEEHCPNLWQCQTIVDS